MTEDRNDATVPATEPEETTIPDETHQGKANLEDEDDDVEKE